MDANGDDTQRIPTPSAELAGVFEDNGHGPDFSIYDDLDAWVNRLVIHNPSLVVSQRIRDILLRYYYSNRRNRLLECR